MAEALVTIRGLGDLFSALRRLNVEARTSVIADGIQAGAEVIRDEIVQLAPRKTGRGAESFMSTYSIANGVAEARIGPERKSFHMAIVNQGAKPHLIRPFVNRRSRRLRGRGRGGRAAKRVLASSTQVFGVRVKHPGVRPRHFMQAGLEQARRRAVQAMARTMWFGIDRVAANVSKGGG